MEAFAENGLEFDVISGTSVGALNGAIWCTGRMELGHQLWSTMGRSHVFSFRPLLLIPALLTLGARVLYALVQGYVPFVGRSHRLLYLTLSIFFLVGPLSFVWFLYNSMDLDEPYRTRWHVGVGVVAVICAATLLWPGKGISQRRGKWIFFGLLPWGTGCGLYVDHFLEHSFDVPGAIFISGGTPVYLLCLAWLTRKMNISIFTAAPLTQTIEEMLVSPFRLPLYATAARESGDYFDPDDVRYFAVGGIGPATPLEYLPSPSVSLVPVYIRVDLLNTSEAREALLATSALPIGIVPSRKGPNKTFLVEGGTVDNIPWFPLVDEMTCSELVIVHCNPVEEWDKGTAGRRWASIDRLQRVVNTGFNPAPSDWPMDIRCEPPRAVPLREPQHWPARVVVVAPCRRLGNFVTGTMNFSQQTAIRRLAAGREAGYRAVRTILSGV